MSQYSTDTVWVGMDVHQDSVTAAILFGDDPKPQVASLVKGEILPSKADP